MFKSLATDAGQRDGSVVFCLSFFFTFLIYRGHLYRHFQVI